MMNESELKVGMWYTWNDYFGGNVGDPHTIKLVGQSDAYIKQRMEQGEVIYNHPATKPEIAKELGWELAKAVGLWMSITYKDVDYPNSLVRAFEKVEYILAEIESGVDDNL